VPETKIYQRPRSRENREPAEIGRGAVYGSGEPSRPRMSRDLGAAPGPNLLARDDNEDARARLRKYRKRKRANRDTFRGDGARA